MHTNLGRAPLAAGAVDAISLVGRNYSNLSFLDSGKDLPVMST